MVPVYLGVMNRGSLSALQLVNQYIRCRQMNEVVNRGVF